MAKLVASILLPPICFGGDDDEEDVSLIRMASEWRRTLSSSLRMSSSVSRLGTGKRKMRERTSSNFFDASVISEKFKYQFNFCFLF